MTPTWHVEDVFLAADKALESLAAHMAQGPGNLAGGRDRRQRLSPPPAAAP